MITLSEKWDVLPKPFKPGTVVPYQDSWAFTFRDANDEVHLHIDNLTIFSHIAKAQMRRFCVLSGNLDLRYHEILDWLTVEDKLLPSNRWFENNPPMNVYLRKVRGRIDLANVELYENERGQGTFTAFLNWLEEKAVQLGYREIKLENVHEERLCAFYVKRGYIVIGPVQGAPSFVKEFVKEGEGRARPGTSIVERQSINR